LSIGRPWDAWSPTQRHPSLRDIARSPTLVKTMPTQRWRKYFEADIPNSAVTPREALQLLMEGNQRFVAGCPRAKTPMERRAQFAAGQSPIASVLCCADSRVAPEILFDQPLGEIFSVRVAGNFLHDDGLASLEYAILKLGTPLIFVLGHRDCGAVKAAMLDARERVALPGKLPALVDALVPAVQHALAQHPADPLDACIRTNVAFEVRDIARAEPLIAPFVEEGRVLVVGGMVDVATGEVTMVDAA
jgi:carbonic anhydrase